MSLGQLLPAAEAPRCKCGRPRNRDARDCLVCYRERVDTDKRDRFARVQQLWKAGRSAPEIARLLRVKPRTVNNLIGRMRREGWDMPRRNGGRPRAWQ